MRRQLLVCVLLLLSVFVLPMGSDADDFPEEEPPEPPPNTAPYILEPPFAEIFVDEEFEWEGRVAVEDNDTIEWDITTNMTGDDYDEYEWEPENYSVKLKVKCAQPFARWFNVSVTDNYWPAAYWNWTLFCIEEEGTRGDDPLHHTDYIWCGSACGGDEYQWDDQNNWRESATGSISGYPSDNDDTASFNETADDLYLVHGANSVVTIGALTTTSGFTGSITFSIDLIIDDARTKNGSLNHKAAATIDVNTSNEQINMDGNLYISSSATFTERAGTLIVQGAATQQIRVQSTNKLYKLTTDTASTVGELYDNLTAYQITIGASTTYKADANTRGYELWTNFSDIAGCGFVSTSSGTLNLIGSSAGRQANISTADAAPPPTVYWTSPGSGTGLLIQAEWATFSYGSQLWNRQAGVDIENSTFDSFSVYGLALGGSTTITALNNNTFSNSLRGVGKTAWGAFVELNNNVFTSNTNDIYASESGGTNRMEFTDSNFDTSTVVLGTYGNILSDTHNDIANNYQIMATTLSKSTITNDYATSDNIQLISGTFTIDIASASNDFTIDSGATLVLNTAQTHTFDADANLTNNGVLKSDGDITTSSGYFDFYNPGSIWLNNSTVSNADLAYHYGGFNFSVGKAANSTIDDFAFEAPALQNAAINFTSMDFSVKGSGVVYHYNATVSSGTLRATVSNLTGAGDYRVYVDGVMYRSCLADGSGVIYYPYDAWSTRHFHLEWEGVGTSSSVVSVNVRIRYEYNIFSDVRVWLDVNESYPLMDYYVWTTEDGREWITYSPYLNFSEPWAMRSDIPLYVTVRNIEGVEGELSTTVQIDHSWLFILIFAIILCVAISYLVSSKYTAIVRKKLNKEVKL